MNTGYNQNVLFKGEVYHVQTEDGGLSKPVVTTLLFKGGTVVSSKRVNYSDIIKSEKLEAVVRSIMAEQHAAMIRELKEGIFHNENKGREQDR